ncbi:MAG: M28 family peptidase [Gemmatimonadales bacterium]|nr:M28 family peptidase [Gemmatimonadales bacterium]NIN11969.1 M28 family peptidase [Gemmatimonadales bacterium]NIN50504.1 M28 family peptidase [Gemmatimonadales bacterium]NIP07968.1 M28 family peptidase [Gemmatimonadales bacterium]NIR01990.1 M28 family peptidase [Gemmatimonadales bacterium]
MRSRRSTSLRNLAACAMLIVPASALWGQERVDPLQSITQAELRDHLYYLASDFLAGRDAGEEGYILAAQYGAVHFRAAGLVPMLSDSSGAPTFFQQIRFETATVSTESVMRVTLGDVERTYRLGQEFLAQPVFASGGDQTITGMPLFLGYGIEEPDLGWNDYEGVDAAGKMALIVGGAPTRNGEPVLPEEKHQMYSRLLRSANTLFASALNHQVATLIVVPDSATATMWDRLASMMNRPTVRPVSPSSQEMTSPPSLSWILQLRPEAAADLLSGTGFDPVSGTGTYTPGPLEKVHVSLDLKRNVESAFSSPNVVALLPGTDSVLKNEYIVVTAHLDHVGIRSGELYNGADDNASGSAAVLEAAEAAAMAPSKRSIIFVLFTSEEGGLLGSGYFVDNPPVPIEQIVLNINLDMVGRNSPPFPESLLALASENERPRLLELITSVNDSRVGANLDLRLNEGEDPQNHVSRSDQLAFIQRDIPAILLTRGFMGPDYHRSSDDPETINYEKVLQAARLAFALAVEAGNREVLFDRE